MRLSNSVMVAGAAWRNGGGEAETQRAFQARSNRPQGAKPVKIGKRIVAVVRIGLSLI
jgi:hypothetical protein